MDEETVSTPDTPTDEVGRLNALRRTRLLDSAPEERFDRLMRLTKGFFGVDIALVSQVDSDRQWFM
ncbi:MAG: hypothetical protein ACI87W_000967 [Halieaceae bacterium]|jgi:hypothetical protein